MKRIKIRETQKHSLFGSMILRRKIRTFYFLSLLRFDTSGTVKHLLVYIHNSHLISSRAFIQVRDTQRTACSTSDATSRDPSPLDGKESCFYKYQIALHHSASAAMGHPLSPAALMQNQAN